MEIDLLLVSHFECGSEVQHMARASNFRKVSRVLHKGIPGFGHLAIEEKSGLPGYISRAALG